MNSHGMLKLNARHGVELWRLISDGVEQFAVRFSHRRARMVGSRSTAESLFAHHVRQSALARAH